MNSQLAPNLYETLSVGQDDECHEVGIRLAGRDAQYEQLGISPSDERRHEVQVGFGILSEPAKRKLYDQALASGRKLTWDELEHLSNFGSWPDPVTRPAEQANFGWSKPVKERMPSPYQDTFSPYGTNDFSAKQVAHSPVRNSQGAYPQGAYSQAGMASEQTAAGSRASASTRITMAMSDFFIAFILASLVTSSESWVYGVILYLIVMVLFVGMEVTMGGSPGKKMMGYEVRNVHTGKRLTWKESAKRQWFRLVWAVPAVGPVISVIATAVYSFTINEANERRGTHDRLGDAEVVKKK